MLDSSSALRASDLKSPSMDMLDFRKVKDWTGAGKISEYGDSDREIRSYRNQYKEFVGQALRASIRISSRDAMSLLPATA